MSAESHDVLDTRALNRSVLARQALLARFAGTIPGLLRQMAFLQAQYAPSMYIGIWSRLQGFRRDDLTRALEQRTVVQATLLRSTIHLVAAEDYWPAALAIRDAQRSWYERVSKGVPGADALRAAAERLRSAFAERHVLSQTEIDELVGRDLRAGVGGWIEMVRVPPSGTWERRRANLYAAAEDWLGPPPADLAEDTDRCIELLVRRYLTGFGPAALAGIAQWAGLPVTAIRAVLDRLAVRRMRSADGVELVDLPDQPLPGPDASAPVRYLPTWDASLLVHCRHARVLPEEYRPRIFTSKSPHSFGTFLVDGSVAGTWRHEGGRIVREEFLPLPKRVRAALDAEAEGLATLHR